MMNEPQPTPFRFLQQIFRQSLCHGQLMVWSKIRRSGRTMTDWCYSLQQAARRIERYRKQREVFFGVALHDHNRALLRARQRSCRARPCQVRGSAESVTALPALWAEVGVAAGALPPDRPAARGLLEAMVPAPSLLVWTGAAYQAYWLLAEPWVLAGDEERRRAARLLARVRWALASAAAAEGWRLAAGGDFSGLMQVAGTFHQPAAERLPVVVELPLRQDRLTVSDFEAATPAGEDPPPLPRDLPWPRGDDGEAAGAGAGADLRPVWRGCSWLRHGYDHQATLPEDEWAAVLSLVGRCHAGPGADGTSLAQSFSRRHPGYRPDHTARQLRRASSGKAGAASCRRIGQALGAWDRHCRRCPHQGQIESPIDLGRRPGGGAVEVSKSRSAPDPSHPAAAAPSPGPTPASAPGPTAAPAPGPTPAPAPGPTAAPSPERTVPAPGARGGKTVPLGAAREDNTAGGLEVEVVLRLRPGTGLPATWAPLLRAAIACLEDQSAGESPAGEADILPAAAPPLPPAGVRRRLLDGLEELIAALGGPATARQMVEALAAEDDRERFAGLRSALRQLFPDAAGGLPTARQMGVILRSCRRSSAGERVLAVAGRGSQGRTWAVRRRAPTRPTAGGNRPPAEERSDGREPTPRRSVPPRKGRGQGAPAPVLGGIGKGG